MNRNTATETFGARAQEARLAVCRLTVCAPLLDPALPAAHLATRSRGRPAGLNAP